MVEHSLAHGSTIYKRSVLPKITRRTHNHKVVAGQVSWCITLRGPWAKTWTETSKETGITVTLGHGRKQLGIQFK